MADLDRMEDETNDLIYANGIKISDFIKLNDKDDFCFQSIKFD